MIRPAPGPVIIGGSWSSSSRVIGSSPVDLAWGIGRDAACGPRGGRTRSLGQDAHDDSGGDLLLEPLGQGLDVGPGVATVAAQGPAGGKLAFLGPPGDRLGGDLQHLRDLAGEQIGGLGRWCSPADHERLLLDLVPWWGDRHLAASVRTFQTVGKEHTRPSVNVARPEDYLDATPSRGACSAGRRAGRGRRWRQSLSWRHSATRSSRRGGTPACPCEPWPTPGRPATRGWPRGGGGG